MPKLVHSSQFIVHSIKKFAKKNTKYLILNTKYCKAFGFTLIELLIVISIFGLTASLITASYLTFERNQRLKSTAQKIKTDLRFVQNEALSGNKGVGSIPSSCLDVTATTLVGYYMKLFTATSENTFYTIAGDCLSSNNSESDFNIKTISLPQGVKITKIVYGAITYDSTNVRPVVILFRPLAHDVTFWDGTAPPFLDTQGQLVESRLLGSKLPQTSDLVIELCREKTPYNVIIRTSGEVYESQPSGACSTT